MTDKLHSLRPLSRTSNFSTHTLSPIEESNPDSESAYFFSSQIEEGDSPVLLSQGNNSLKRHSQGGSGLLTPNAIKQKPYQVVTGIPQKEKTFILSVTSPRTDLYEHFNPFSSIQEFLSYSKTESSNMNNSKSSLHKKENYHPSMNTIVDTSHKRRHSSPMEFQHTELPSLNRSITVPVTVTSNNTSTSPRKCYAGGAFHNSPAPDTLPIPEFVNTKVIDPQLSKATLSPKPSVVVKSPTDKITPYTIPPSFSSISSCNGIVNTKTPPQNRKVRPSNSKRTLLKNLSSNEPVKVKSKTSYLPNKMNIGPTSSYSEILSNDLKRMLNIIPTQVI